MGIFGKFFGRSSTHNRQKELEEFEAKRKEFNEVATEFFHLQQSLEQESDRFRKEISDISKAKNAKTEKQLALFCDGIDQITATDQSSIATAAELMLLLADFDSENATQASEALRLMREAKLRHDTETSRLIACRDECYNRLVELAEETYYILALPGPARR